MKLIKLMLAGIVVMAFSFGQDQTQDGGQPPQGPPPCDPNATYPVADPGPDGGCANYNDCNGNGAYDAGEPCGEHGDGPDWLPFEDVDADNDGLISRDEARDKYGTDPEGNDVEDFDQKFDDVDTDNNGSIDPGEYYAAQSSDQDGDQGPPTCDVCGYTFAGEGDHHGHCDKCDFVFTSDNDQHGHCDQCDYVFSGEGDR
ncbi:MAG: EF-hand domain-containing protein, partial [Candidatus Marinimicrobia bacterium]|nr:EF-hand domain-containing protein [Candidatus Neomarinimicrobiota bacterium]